MADLSAIDLRVGIGGRGLALLGTARDCTARGAFCAALAVVALATGPPARPVEAATGQLELVVVDRETGEPTPCRMHLLGPGGKAVRPEGVPFWHDHFVLPGKITLKLPLGSYTFELERGPEYRRRLGHFQINRFADDSQRVDLERCVDLAARGWWSGDLDVRRDPRDLELLMSAEDLHLAEVAAWGNDPQRRFPQRPAGKSPVYFGGDRYCWSLAGVQKWPGTEVQYFGLPAPLDLPAPAEFPPPVEPMLKARELEQTWIDLPQPFCWDLPLLVALGQVDSIEVADSHLCRDTVISNEADGKPRDKRRFPDPWGVGQWSQFIYFQLLEAGLRIPPSAGSGSGAAPNPVGYNRVYVHLDGPLSCEKWFEGLRAGRVVVTNGPLMQPSVEGELPGHTFRADEGQQLEFEIGLTLSTREPISYLEILKNGQVERSIRFEEYAQSGKLPTVAFDRSGWFLIRAVCDTQRTYRFAMTGPYFVEVGYQRRVSRKAAQFFLDWVYERARRIELADPQQRRQVLDYHRRARDFWQDLVDRANAD